MSTEVLCVYPTTSTTYCIKFLNITPYQTTQYICICVCLLVYVCVCVFLWAGQTAVADADIWGLPWLLPLSHIIYFIL